MSTAIAGKKLSTKPAEPDDRQRARQSKRHPDCRSTTIKLTAHANIACVIVGPRPNISCAPDNIQANAVLPGWIDTDLTRRARQEIDGLHDRVLARTPAARWGVSADFAGIAVFLSSSASDFITGTAIPIDGGFSVMG